MKKFKEFINEQYSIKSFKNILSRYSDKLNPTFKDDTEHRVVDWLYEWEYKKGNERIITLDLSKYGNYKNKYHISFDDNRDYSWKKIKNTMIPSGIGFVPFGRPGSTFEDMSDYTYHQSFDNLEDALNLLQECGIDTSGVTRT